MKPKKNITAKKTTAKIKKQTITKAKSKKILKAKPEKLSKPKNGMNYFQQCLVLGALINQKRMLDIEFRKFPLYELHSEVLKPLREFLSQYKFSHNDIMKATQDLLKSDHFKKLYPIKTTSSENILILVDHEPKMLVNDLLQLAGTEARRVIYIKGIDPHDVQKTTLEKYAIHTDQIDHRPEHPEVDQWKKEHMMQNKMPEVHFRRHGSDFSPFKMASHRRGRG